MPTLEAGTVFIQVAPSFKGFQAAASKAGIQGGEALAKAFEKTAEQAKIDAAGMVDGASEEGARAAAEFQATFKAALQGANGALAEIKVGADSSEADRKLAELRGRMMALSDKTIGVDIDAQDAYLELGMIGAELTRLSAKHPNVEVRADIVRALSQLQAVEEKAEALDHKNVDVEVKADTRGLNGMGFAVQSTGMLIGGLVASIAMIGPAAANAASVAVMSLTGIGAAASGAIAGIGTSLLALAPVVSSVAKYRQAKTKTVAPKAVGGLGRTARPDTSKQDARQVTQAQKQITAARKTSARSAADWAKKLQAAEKNVADVSEVSAKRVSDAQNAVSRAREQAAKRTQAANKTILTAEKQLAAAQKGVQKAQENLSKARREAVKDLRDLQAAVKNGTLAERSAALQVKQAQKALEDLGKTGGTALEWEAARLALDEANQSLADQKTANADLAEQKARTDREGVDGTERVQAAQEALVAAQERVLDAVEAVAEARQRAADEADASAQQIADAEQRLVDARLQAIEDQEDALERLRETQADAAEAAQDNARREQDAKDRLVEVTEDIAERNARVAASAASAGAAGVGAGLAMEDALSGLPKAGQDFVVYLDGLIDRLGVLSATAQNGFLPGFQRGLQSLEPLFPHLNDLVDDLSGRLGRMSENALKSLNNPQWQAFGQFLQDHLGNAMESAGRSIGYIIAGLRDLIMALEPLGSYFQAAFEDSMKRFAQWAAGLKDNPAFNEFVENTIRTAPKVARLLGEIARAIANLWSAAKGSDESMGSTSGLTGFFQKIADTDPARIGAIAKAAVALGAAFAGMSGIASVGSMIGSISNGLKAVAGVLGFGGSAGGAAGAAGGGGLVAGITQLGSKLAALAGPIGIAIGVITAIAGAVKYLWDTNEGFRNTVTKAWQGIQDMFTKAYNQVFKPVFDGLGELFSVAADIFKTIFGGILTSVWNGVLGPLFNLIGDIVGKVFNGAILPYFSSGASAFKTLASTIKTVWEKNLKPVFDVFSKVVEAVFVSTLGSVLKSAKGLFDGLASGIGKIMDGIRLGFKAFGQFLTGDFTGAWRTAKDAIARVWDGVKTAAASPINFVIDVVWNNGIAAGFNNVAGALRLPVSLPRMRRISFAQGGILPGYTPGRDVHRFFSPTGGLLYLSGGEGIIRPDALRALGGKRWLDWVNKHLRGNKPVVGDFGDYRAAAGGIIPKPQRFAKGGIWDGVLSWAGGAAKAIGSAIRSTASFIDDVLDNPLEAFKSLITRPAEALLASMGSGFFDRLASAIPRSMFTHLMALFNREAGKKGGGFGSRLVRYLRRNVVANRVPYVWGGSTIPPGLDCSGMVYYGYNHMPQGRAIPRLTAAGYDAAGRRVSWGEKRTGDLLVNAKRSHIAVYAGGNSLIEEPRPGKVAQEVPMRGGFHAVKYDEGGWLPTGVTQTLNLTGKPEPIFTAGQWDTLSKIARNSLDGAGSGPTFNINNHYPQEEPTSVTVNRGLRMLAAMQRSVY